MRNTTLDICHLANYNLTMMNNDSNNLGKIVRQRRVMIPLTLQELGAQSSVSPSHLGRIEKGGRFPSARILRKIAAPLGFEEDELFALAGYLSPHSPGVSEGRQEYSGGGLDPYVSRVLAQEPIDVQRATIGILTILKSIAKSTAKE
ncbi:helix-turn-helix domain-containing protein [Chloroflexota bacterium]